MLADVVEAESGKNLLPYQPRSCKQKHDSRAKKTWQEWSHKHSWHKYFFFSPSPPEAQLKHPISPLSCLSLPLIKAYNELGTATESQDWWLYGPGRIIALCGLSVRKRTPRLDGTGAHREVGERERQRGGKQRLKFYIVTFERHFATRYYSVWCVPCCLNLPRNKCFDKRGLKWWPGSKQGTKVFHALITALLSPLLYFGAIKKLHLFVNWH